MHTFTSQQHSGANQHQGKVAVLSGAVEGRCDDSGFLLCSLSHSMSIIGFVWNAKITGPIRPDVSRLVSVA